MFVAQYAIRLLFLRVKRKIKTPLNAKNRGIERLHDFEKYFDEFYHIGWLIIKFFIQLNKIIFSSKKGERIKGSFR